MAFICSKNVTGTGDMLDMLNTYMGYKGRVRLAYRNISRQRTLSRLITTVSDNLNR